MTRINTNVSSLNAQNSLSQSNKALRQALTRLSTGLRINSGRDDPAGLIASEMLRSDIVSIEKAISNSQRANQMIATADSALGQVSALLNDVRGLVTEAANSGAMSDDQIAANQLQVDSSLAAINRIAQTTAFQGRKLVDGSLDFITSAGTNFDTTVTDLQINQANLGTAGSMAVNVDIATAAEKAVLTNSTAFTTAAAATTTVDFAASISTTALATNANAWDIRATALGADYDGATIELTDSDGSGKPASAVWTAATKKLVITVDGDLTDTEDVMDAINAEGHFSATVAGGAAAVLAAIDVADDPLTTLVGTTDVATLQIDAIATGAQYNNVSVLFETAVGQGAATPGVAYDAVTKELVITIDSATATTLANLEIAIDAYAPDGVALFASTPTAGTAIPSMDPTGADVDVVGNTGTSGGALLKGDLVLELSGLLGAEVFNFELNGSLNGMADSINLVSDATGVTASYTGNTLTLNSSEYGSKQFAAANVLSEASTGAFLSGLSARRDYGADIEARVNGYAATGDGNTLALHTATLDMAATVTAGSSTDFAFTISGGGALFQLGPEVVSNNQARLGIGSISSARLGGNSGRLYQLASGESASLTSDPTTAARIVDEAISKVTSLRGRLGAFQKTTIDTNIDSLTDTLENLTEAESTIRDADFAEESASLTRAQILVQSGTSVLAIANQQPQNVLALLR